MDIYEALEKLDDFFSTFTNMGMYTDEELDLIDEIEDVIYQFARKYEPRVEDLPIKFTCTCGTHMTRNGISDNGYYAQFICPKCNSVWLLGRPFEEE